MNHTPRASILVVRSQPAFFGRKAKYLTQQYIKYIIEVDSSGAFESTRNAPGVMRGLERTMQFTETMTPSRRLMEHLFGEDAPAVRHALLECGPTRSDDPVDQLIDAMAEAEFASLMDDLARRAKVSTPA